MTIEAFVRKTVKEMRVAMQEDNFERFCRLADSFDYYDEIFIGEIEDELREDEDLNELHSLIIEDEGLLIDLYYEAKDAKKKKYASHIARLNIWKLFTGHQ